MILQNSFNLEDNTFKQFYYACSDDETQELRIEKDQLPQNMLKRKSSSDSLDTLFEVSKTKKKKISSTVSHAHREGGNVFISTNEDDGPRSKFMIKIEVFNMQKLNKIPSNEHWKHASYRLKYFANETNQNYESIKKIIFNVTKEIVAVPTSKKVHFNN